MAGKSSSMADFTAGPPCCGLRLHRQHFISYRSRRRMSTDAIRWDEKAGLRTGCGVRSQVIDVLKAQIKRRPAMKKVSTAVMMQSRNISQQKLTIGLDLGDRNSWYCAVDEAGQIQREQRVSTSAKALREVFGAMLRSRIALEIGTHSPWISRLLSELGHELWRTLARVQCAQHESGKGRELESGTANRTAAITHSHRIGQRAHCRVQRAHREAGAGTLSASRAADADQGRRYPDRADVSAHVGRSASLSEEPRREQRSGAAAGTQELGRERAADAHQQGRRSVSADAAGAGSAAHPGTIRS